MKIRPRCVMVTYVGYDWGQDDKIKDAFNMKGVSCDGSGCGFGGRDIFFYTNKKVDLNQLYAEIKRVKRWKYNGEKVKVSLYFDKD